MLYGMITFVMMTVIFLGLFIWQLTDNKKLADEAAKKARQLRAIGSPSAYYSDEATARSSTAVDVMTDDLNRLATLIAGARDAVGRALEQEAARVLSEIETATNGTVNRNDTLLTALRKLNSAHSHQASEISELEKAVATLTTENETLSNGVKLARAEFEEQVAELSADLSRIETDKQESLAAKDEQLARTQQSAESTAEELNRFRVEKQRADRTTEVDLARKDKQIDDLQEKIAGLRPSGFDHRDILTKADGQVLRAIPGSDVVFLNIGSSDRIREGLTFEVYSTYGERSPDFRGKASIEVTAVTEDTAECRVTRRAPGRPIIEGDIVVNIAYERNRRPKFVIRGDFDLNYDGTIDWDGMDRVKSIVRDWGGQVVDDVDESTDFVVIGTGPQVPDVAGRRQMNVIFEDLVGTQAKKAAEFQDVIEMARTRNLPIVTQSQFLFLTGFAGREDVLSRGS
jgi:hypothetical protein